MEAERLLSGQLLLKRFLQEKSGDLLQLWNRPDGKCLVQGKEIFSGFPLHILAGVGTLVETELPIPVVQLLWCHITENKLLQGAASIQLYIGQRDPCAH